LNREPDNLSSYYLLTFREEVLKMRKTLLMAVTIYFLLGLGIGGDSLAYEEIEVTDGGTITGKVSWQGEVPSLEPLAITKNPEVCDHEGTGNKKSPRLIVSAEGGVKNTVVFLEEISQGKPLNKLAGKLPRLDQKNCEYDPHVIIAPVKKKLEMVSSDDILHNIHMRGAAKYNLPFPIKGRVLAKRLKKGGIVELVCDAGHAWMSAYIHVITHPYYALTDAEGNFRIEDTPPGNYQLVAWHEGWEVVKTESKDGKITRYMYSDPVTLKKEVTVPAKGDVKIDFELSGQ
jgi:hypothetical protein